MTKEAIYWVALAHLPKWGTSKINNLIIKFHHQNKISIEEFFSLNEREWRNDYELDNNQINDLKGAKSELPNNAFLMETYLNEGYEIIPIVAPEYSKILKDNMKVAQAPPILYVKGNKNILNRDAVAIVGRREASAKSLEFTVNIAKKVCAENKVVVSGFARGVDRQALDATLQYNGQSIIVLPQGIMTFAEGFRTYYKQIVEGNVLILSTFYPKYTWRTEFAMARNSIIYGLANEIYIAETADKGGTWSGAINGLRKKRKIFVRKPNIDEQNANEMLIEKGCVPIDFNGNIINQESPTDHHKINTQTKLF